MSAQFRLRPAPSPQPLPLDEHQRQVLDQVKDTPGAVLITGDPGAGRSTIALHALAHWGDDALLITPDRARAKDLEDSHEARGVNRIRPVITPTALAYHLCCAALGTRLKLQTGPGQDARIAQALTQLWHDQELWPQLFHRPHDPGLPPLTPDASEEWAGYPDFDTDTEAATASASVVTPPAATPLVKELRQAMTRLREDGIDAPTIRAWLEQSPPPGTDTSLHAAATRAITPQQREIWRFVAAVMEAVLDGDEPDSLELMEMAIDAVTRGQAGPPVVIVDDLHDCPRTFLRLLAALGANGSRIIATSQPEIATEAFRGAAGWEGHELARSLGATILDLGPSRRFTDTIAGVSATLRRRLAALEDRLGPTAQDTPAAVVRPWQGRVSATSTAGESQAGVSLIRSHSQLGAGGDVAAMISLWHLRDGVSLDDIAVIGRSGGQLRAVVTALEALDIKVSTNESVVHFASDSLVGPLLRFVVDPATAPDLIYSPLVEIDFIHYRKLARLGVNTAQLCSDPEYLARIEALAGAEYEPVFAAIRRIHAMRDALGQAGVEGKCGTVIYRVWEAAGIDASLQEQAANGSEIARRKLHAVTAMLRHIDTVTQLKPDLTALEYAAEQLELRVGVDTIITNLHHEPAVTVATPAAVAGKTFAKVVVIGFQDRQWPDLRVRDQLLETGILAQLIAAGRAAQVAGVDAGETQFADWEALDVLHRQRARGIMIDELRMALAALTRARCELVISSYVSEDEDESFFYTDVTQDWLAAGGAQEGDGGADSVGDSQPVAVDAHGTAARPAPGPAGGQEAIGMRQFVAHLRRIATGQTDLCPAWMPVRDSAQAVEILAFLAAQGVVSADPTTWTVAAGEPEPEPGPGDADAGWELISDTRPVYPKQVVVSPSRAEKLLKCPVRWILETHGAEKRGDTAAADFGTMVHAFAQHYAVMADDPRSEDELDAAFAQMRQLLTEVFERSYPDDDFALRGLRKRAEAVAQNLPNYLRNHRAEEVEFDVRANFGKVRVGGRLDRLNQIPQSGTQVGVTECEIVDFKSSSHAIAQNKVAQNPQLLLYRAALEETESGAEKNYRATAATLYYPVPEKKVRQTEVEPQVIAEIIDEIWLRGSGSRFATTSDTAECRTCPLHSVCPLTSERMF